jgi:hypothetical protein
MDRTRFDALLEAYGADMARWPEADRAEAEAFAAAPEAQASLHAARALDRLLDAYQAEAPSLALRQRILARAPQARAARGWRLTGAVWLSGASLAAACAAGLVVGISLGGTMTSGSADRDTAAASFDGSSFDGATAFGSPIDAGKAG